MNCYMSISTSDATVDQIVDEALIRTVYQPIVELDSGRVAAYEALSRGPAGSPLEAPDRLFAAAAERTLTTELDWLCRASALQGALESGLGCSTRLFVNVEPSTLRSLP